MTCLNNFEVLEEGRLMVLKLMDAYKYNGGTDPTGLAEAFAKYFDIDVIAKILIPGDSDVTEVNAVDKEAENLAYELLATDNELIADNDEWAGFKEFIRKHQDLVVIGVFEYDTGIILAKRKS